MLAVDRAVTNTHEQMGPFLVSLWLLAVYASRRMSRTGRIVLLHCEKSPDAGLERWRITARI